MGDSPRSDDAEHRAVAPGRGGLQEAGASSTVDASDAQAGPAAEVAAALEAGGRELDAEAGLVEGPNSL